MEWQRTFFHKDALMDSSFLKAMEALGRVQVQRTDTDQPVCPELAFKGIELGTYEGEPYLKAIWVPVGSETLGAVAAHPYPSEGSSGQLS
jgi:hypothetical protein